MVKYVLMLFLKRLTGVRICVLPNFFPLPFQIRYVGKACIFNNNKGNNLKVELKVSGRVRVGEREGFIVPIR